MSIKPSLTPNSYFGFLSKTDKETGEEFVNRLRRSSKEKTYVKNLPCPVNLSDNRRR